MSFVLVFCIYTYMVGPNRGPQILLLLMTTRIMRLKRLFFIRKQGRIVYKVRWTGCGATEDIWLREEDLVNALDFL